MVSASPNTAIPDDTTTLTSTIKVDQDITLETIEIPFISDHTWRGDLTIELTSPAGTTATLAVGDSVSGRGDRGSYNFTFSAKTFWGESSAGDWTIAISDQYPTVDSGDLNSWGINFYGTPGSNYQSNRPQQSITANDDIIGSSGQTYASKEALDSVPGLSSYITYVEYALAESTSSKGTTQDEVTNPINGSTQEWLIATDRQGKRALKDAGFQNVDRQDSITSKEGDAIKLFKADTTKSLDSTDIIDNLDAQLGSNFAFAYPDIAHDLQTRSVIPLELLA